MLSGDFMTQGDRRMTKDEIERLKADYAKLQEQFTQYQIASDKEIIAQKKQAQIDVLNELKKGDRRMTKDEIERLKADYAKLQEQFTQYQIASDKEIIAQKKQAQIDVLNELKKCSYTDNFFPDGKWHRYVLVSDIDEIIKELNNEN